MFRLMGFLLGSAVSIAALLVFLGVPEFHLSSFESDQARFDAAIEKIREKQPEIQQLVENVGDSIEETLAEALPPAVEERPAELMSEPVTEPAGEPAAEVEDELAAISDIAPPERDAVMYEQHWHEFWNPFHSEIAARGFVTQLEKVTGLDYRIIKVKAGVYQVGFAYQDDAERMAKISQISAATGLEFPEQ